jgi:large subunit ribosomal protein L25
VSGKDVALVVEERSVQGKQVRQLRRDGMIPAVIHDHGKESKIVMVPLTSMQKVYNEAGKHHPLSITLGKQNYMALIKDVDFEPKKHLMRHVVFNAIAQDQKVQTEVPIHVEGDIPAEKVGLMVIKQLDAIEIEALPKDLIDSVSVDASGLAEIGDKITVADIKVPDGVVILTELEHPIATIEETKAQISEEAEEAAEGEESGEAAEGEEKPEGEGGGEAKSESGDETKE